MKSKSFFFGTLALLTSSAFAQSTWNGTTNNSWATAGNWSPSGIPASGVDIIINNTTGSGSVLVLDSSRTIDNLQFGTTGTRTAAFSLRSTSANTLTLDGGLTATGAFTGVGLSLFGNFTLGTAQVWNIGGQIGTHNGDRGVFVREIVEANGTSPAGAAAIGSFVMNANLNKTGTGQLVFAATNISGAGNFIVDEGALKLNAGASRLLTVGGTGNITLNNSAQLFLSRNSGTMYVTRNIIANNTSGMVWGGGGTANDNTVASNIAWSGTTHTLELPVANRYESSGAWTGSATVNRTGTSTLTLSGDLSGFTGTLNLNGGTNNINGNIGGAISLATGATLNGEFNATSSLSLNGGNLTVNPNTTAALSTTGNLTLSGTNNISLSTAPTSSSPFTVITYGGTLTGGTANLSLVGGSSNYRTPTFDDATPGIITLAVGSESRTWNSGAAWDINTSSNWQEADNRYFQLDSVTFDNSGTAGSIAITGILTPSSITVDSTNDYTFTATTGNLIAGTTGITKSGTGTLTIGGENTYTGPINVNAGTLRPTSSSALGANGNTITVASGAALDQNGAWGVNRDFNAIIAGNGTGAGALINNGLGQNAGFRSLTLTADATIGGTGRFDIRPIVAGTGVIDLDGFTLTKSGTNLIALVDSVFTSDGNIEVSQGELRYTRNSTTGTTGSLSLASGTLLTFENNSSGNFGWDLEIDNATIQSLGTAYTLNSAAALTNTATFNLAVNLNLAGNITGSGAISKTGTAALILTGDATHNGGTTVTTGALQIGASGTSGSITGNITNDTTVTFDRSDASSYSGSISGIGALIKQGTGTLTLNGANNYTGNTTINGGSLQLGTADDRLPTTTNLILANNATANLDLNGLNQEIRTLSGGGATGGQITNTGASPSTLTIRPTTTDGATFSGIISGDTRLEILGDKTSPSFVVPRQRLANLANTFTGGILVDGATLMARQDGSLGAIPVAFEADSITLQNNGTLLNEADGNALSIHQNRGITLGSGGGAFVAGFNQPLTVNSVITGSAGNTITILGNNGTVFFTADNTYLGDTILGPVTASGTSRLTIGNGGTSGTLGAGNVTNDGQLTFNRSDAHSYNGDISGTGTLIKQGAGTLTLGGTSTYTGTTTISAGTLLINGSLGNTAVSIADAARLGGSDGSITGSVTTAAAGSIIAPGNSPGTLTLGALNVTAGATFEYELGTNSDLLEITGALTGGGTLTFNFFDSGDIAALTPYTLFTFGSQTGLDYADLVANTFPGNFILDTNFGTGGWQINSGNLQVQFIPEPSSALLAPLGLLLAARRRRQR